MRLSLHYRQPIHVLQQRFTTREFVELMAFDRHETLDPDGWLQAASVLRKIDGFGKGKGERLEPLESYLPTTPWPGDCDSPG